MTHSYFRHRKVSRYLKITALIVGGVYLIYEQSSFGVMLEGNSPQFAHYPLTFTLGTICEFFNLGGIFVAIFFSLGPVGFFLFGWGFWLLWIQVFRRPSTGDSETACDSQM